MASQLFWRRMPKRVTGRWLFRRNRTHRTTHVTGQWLRRRRTRTWPDFSSLPDEIKEQILLKLRCIKSIVTCTSVCKSWHALIKSRGFITMHLSRRDDSTTEYFLCSYFTRFLYSIDFYNSERLEKYYDFVFPWAKRIRVRGSCHGLICYTKGADVSNDIYLWNPIIRKLKILPKSEYYTKNPAYGFWFDTNSDDYKVAKISCKKVSRVEVYSMRSNSWNVIATSGPSYSETYNRNIVHVNGTLFWLTFEGKIWRLNSFNMKHVVFRDTMCATNESMSSGFCSTLGTRSDSIFVLRDNFEGMSLHVYDESLNELYRNEFESHKEILRSLGVRNNGDVLFQKFGTDPSIVIFNIKELKFEEFCPSAKTILGVVPFVETLVLLDDGDSSSIPNAR